MLVSPDEVLRDSFASAPLRRGRANFATFLLRLRTEVFVICDIVKAYLEFKYPQSWAAPFFWGELSPAISAN